MWIRKVKYICPKKVIKMGSIIIGLEVDYNGVGVWEASGTYPAKMGQSSPAKFIEGMHRKK